MIGLARLIRDHGDAVEADLAFRQIDLRDLYRRGSGLTLRRLLVLIRALPADAVVWGAMRAAEEKELTSVERNRARAEHYRNKAKEAE